MPRALHIADAMRGTARPGEPTMNLQNTLDLYVLATTAPYVVTACIFLLALAWAQWSR